MKLIDANAFSKWITEHIHPFTDSALLQKATILDKLYTETEIKNVVEWIDTEHSMPKERPSIFFRFYRTDKWNKLMWRYESDKCLVSVRLKDGTKVTTTARTRDGKWNTDLSDVLEPEVEYWMPFPAPKEE